MIHLIFILWVEVYCEGNPQFLSPPYSMAGQVF